MKHLLIIAVALLLTTAGKAQMIHNNTGCDIQVTPICYNSNNYPMDCMLEPPGGGGGTPITVPPYSSVPLPTCNPNPPFVTVAYEICWASHLCPLGTCVTLDASAGMYPDCKPPLTPPPPPGSPWPWAGVTATTIPPCSDCQGFPNPVPVRIDAAGDIYFN